MTTICSFDELVAHLSRRAERRRVAVVCPNDASTQYAVGRALDEGFISAILVGCTEEARQVFQNRGGEVAFIDAADADDAARKAVQLVREGQADVLQKGLLNTDNLLHAVLNKETGILPKGQVLTHLTCAQIPAYDRFLFFSDAAVIPQPTAPQREAQLTYLLDLCRSMGVEQPRVGLINCTEKVNEKYFPFTVEYKALIAKVQTGIFGPCIVDGPLDLKTCLSAEALHKKGIDSPLEGRSDAVIFPDIQSGNVFYKTITLFGEACCAGLLRGAACPIVLPSRGDSKLTKFYSLALAAV